MNSIKSKNHLLVQNYLNLFSLNHQFYSTPSGQIKIPNYIPRGKTDILKALASTVQQSPYVLQYGYFSDPRLSPKNVREIKNYALAKENGVKAAQYFMKNYPELFYRDVAEPKIEKFSYPDVFNDQMNFDLIDIQSSIEKRNVSNAIIAFKKMSADGQVEIPLELKLSLFELVCFFNSKDAFDCVEELPFSRGMTARHYELKNIWEKDGFADQMWNDIFSKENNIIANSAFIQSLVKFGSYDRAYLLFKDFEKDKKETNLSAIESLIRALPFVNVLDHTVENLVKFLDLINKKSIEPTIETINSLLFSLSLIQKSSDIDINQMTEKLLLDCKILQLTPTLGTYSHVLKIFYKQANTKDDIIYKIIDRIQNSKIEVQSKDDLIFFDEAMKIASLNLSDSNLAIMIYDLFKENKDVYLNMYRQANIYDNFFVALAKNSTAEILFDYYDKICPGIFFPTPSILESLVDHVIVFSSFEYIEKLIGEIEKYNYLSLNSLEHKIFHLIVSAPRNEKTDEIFFQYLYKSFESTANAQLRINPDRLINKNVEKINFILDHMIFLDKEVEVAKFISQVGSDVELIEERNTKKFYSKLLQKLIDGEHANEAITVLKFCVSREYGELDDELVRTTTNSNLKPNQKQLIKSLLLLS